MYPLLEVGPLRLSTGGLLLLAAAILWAELLPRAAWALGGPGWIARAERCALPALAGAAVGGRLWYGLLSWDLYGRDPWLFLALRIGDAALPGALVGGALALALAARRARAGLPILADAALLALAPAQALAAVGLLLSGEALGAPAALPWAVPMLGADRHPTQVYYMLGALIIWGLLRAAARAAPVPGAVAAAGLALQGTSMLAVEPLRADSLLLPGGVRAAQVFGLALVLIAIQWWRRLAPALAAGPGERAPAGPEG